MQSKKLRLCSANSNQGGSVDKGEIQKKIKEAKELVGGDSSDPLTQIAFREVFRMLLQQSSQPAVYQRDLRGALAAQGMQINEFLAQRKIRSETDRLCTILYHQIHNGQNSSTRAEILQAYSSARIQQPTNLSDVIARCIRKGHVIEALEKKDGQKAWQITATGERYVQEELAP
jgi:hypothetical protein